MKRPFLLSLAFCLSLSPLSAATVVNRPVATVNGEAILMSEFDKNWTAFIEQQKTMMPADKMTPAWEQETKKKLLDQMIDDKLLLQEAKKQKVRVTQRDFENGLTQVKARFLPEKGQEAFKAIVGRMLDALPPEQQSGIDDPGIDLVAAWKELTAKNPGAVKEADANFKEELAKEGLSAKQFEERIRDQLMVRQFASYKVRDLTPEPTEEQVKEIYAQLQDVMAGKEPKGLDKEAAEDLKSMAKYFTAMTGERVRARHILIVVEKDAPFKDKSAARSKAESLRQRALKGEDFADLAEKNSDDKASAVQGGDLGFFGRGQMVPPFEKAAFGLNVGDISNVVETDFGYHVIKVEEKKAAVKVKYEDVKPQLKKYAFDAHAQENFEKYMNDLRKGASIKVQADPAAPAKN